MRPGDFLWSDEEVARLKRRRADGLSFGAIAREMGLTRNAVIGKATRLGMVPSGTMARAPAPQPHECPACGRTFTPTVKYRQARACSPECAIALRLSRPSKVPKPMKPLPEIPAEPTQAVELPPDVSSFACTLFELETTSCRWPIADSPDWLFCGAAKLDGYSYCSRHHEIAHRPAPRSSVPMAWRERAA